MDRRMSSEKRRARLAIAAIFFVNGAAFSSWVTRIPQVKANLGLGENELGLALLGVAAGALVAMSLAGALVGRVVGSRAMVRATVLLYCGVLPLPALAPGLLWLAAALAALGAAVGTLDVVVNTYGVALERRVGRAILASLHGAFSLGLLAGALSGAVAAAAGLAPWVHLAIVGAGLGAFSAVAAWRLIPTDDRPEPRADDYLDGRPGQRFGKSLRRRPSRKLIALGAIAFCSALAEGAVADWSGVYLAESLGAGAGLAAAGFSAFSLTMAVSRLAGDRLRRRFGDATLTRWGGALAAVGLAGGLLADDATAAIVAFGLVGTGVSLVFPIALSAAGRLPGVSTAPAIAGISTTGYFAFMVGPPLIGFIAERYTLPVALGLVVVFSAGITVLGRAVQVD